MFSIFNKKKSSISTKTQQSSRIRYTEFLTKLHQLLKPNLYFEIGVRDGSSLTLSQCLSIGVDPRFSISHLLSSKHKLFEMTSDDFFANENLLDISQGKKVDLAFIDGMHLSEYAYRDLINTISYCHAHSVIVLDDIIPASMEITTREQRIKGGWTGDVYKLIHYLLAENVCEIQTVDTLPSGLAILTNFKNANLTIQTDVENALIGDRYSIASRETLIQKFRPVPYQVVLENLKPYS